MEVSWLSFEEQRTGTEAGAEAGGHLKLSWCIITLPPPIYREKRQNNLEKWLQKGQNSVAKRGHSFRSIEGSNTASAFAKSNLASGGQVRLGSTVLA